MIQAPTMNHDVTFEKRIQDLESGVRQLNADIQA